MGEVYQATDTKLKRQVAIKVLPAAVAADAERLARFQREAEVLAALNHPNIAAIYGLEDAAPSAPGAGAPAAAFKALVMELVEGPTLADRIAMGAIPVDEALPIAKQIAEALEAAHEQGIIHRDLKPANVKVRPDGTVKVLDFGLAKAMEPVGVMSPGASQMPTITTPAMTQAGMILGTAAYMSPEQARGRATDRRSDIWAFGVVLFEMLSGRRVFEGEDVSVTLAAILMKEPEWAALPPATPPAVANVLRHCLQRDQKRRVRDIGDVLLALEGAFETGVPQGAPEAGRPAGRGVLVPLATAVGATLVVAGLLAWTLWPAPEPGRVSRFEITTPPEAPLRTLLDFSDLAIAPDGSRIAYATGTVLETGRAWVREVDQLEATELRGSGFAADLFFSPDGERVGFRDLSDAGWKQVSLRGGPVTTIVDLNQTYTGGASWGADGTLVYGGPEGLWQVSATGGTPELLTKVEDPGASHRWPDVLPDGRGVLFTEWAPGGAQILVVSRATGEVVPLVSGGSHPRYASSGHIVYAVDGTLWAVAFDAARLAVTGSPVPLVEGVRTKTGGAALFDIAQNGSLVYLQSGSQGSLLEAVWVDRNGRVEPVETLTNGQFLTPRLSPDGSRVLVANGGDAWVYDLADGRSTRLTTEGLAPRYVVWDPTGSRVAYSSTRGSSENNVWVGPVDGSGAPELLVEGEGGLDVESWSADGRVLVAHQHTANTGENLVTIPLDGATPEVRPFLANEFNTSGTVFSPDGQYVAYTSNESGVEQVYVRPFPGAGGQVTASVGGGREPVWGRNGELFYRGLSGDRMMAVAVQVEPALRLSTPVELFRGEFLRDPSPVPQYDVTADGQRFLMLRSPVVAPSEGAVARPKIVLVEHFFEELKRLAPAN
jgi:serine/threonine-protein kinase